MSEPRAYQGNAADPKQVRFAGRKQQRVEDEIDSWYLAVLKTYEGRAMLRHLIEEHGVYKSVWSPSALIHYNAGRQDGGHELMARLARISEEHYLEMEREAMARARRTDREVEAANLPPASEKGSGQ